MTVFNIEHTLLSRNNTAYSEHIVKKLTVCTKGINSITLFCVVTVNSDCANTGVHVEVFTEIVLIACKSYPATLNESRTNTVTSTIVVGGESTHGCAVFIEGVGNTTNGHCGVCIELIISTCIAIHCERCTTVDVIITLVGAHILPACYEFTVYSVVQVTICLNNACAKNSNVTASYTSESCINNLIVVAGSLNNSTEINYGLTGLAVGTAGVACLSTSCCLISKSNKFCIVNVVRRRNCCEFGFNVDGTCEGVAINNTVNDFRNDVNNRLVAHFCSRIICFVYSIITVIYPYTNGNANKSVIESLSTYAVSFNGNGKKLRNFVILKGCLEAICNNCTLSFPSVGVIQLNNSNKLVYVCEVCNVNVNVVDRLCLRSFAGIVVTAKFNNSITCNSKGTSDLHGVAKFILNLKCNDMSAGSESNVALGGEHIAVDGGFNNNTVNSDLTGG